MSGIRDIRIVHLSALELRHVPVPVPRVDYRLDNSNKKRVDTVVPYKVDSAPVAYRLDNRAAAVDQPLHSRMDG